MTRPDNEPARLRSVAENLAAEAAAFVRGRRAEVFGISRAGDGDGAVRAKSSPTDPVTVVDTDTERLLRDRLAQLRPGDPILGEEGGGPADVTATPSDRVTWVLDPIDGTVNFVYGIPAYAVSIGAQVGGITVAGAVADVAARTVYSAATGLGAHLTDERGDMCCGAPVSTSCRWRCWVPASGTGSVPREAGRIAGSCCAVGPRRASDRFCGAGLVHGSGGSAGRLLRARGAGVGLCGRCVDRR